MKTKDLGTIKSISCEPVENVACDVIGFRFQDGLHIYILRQTEYNNWLSAGLGLDVRNFSDIENNPMCFTIQGVRKYLTQLGKIPTNP